MFGTLDGEGDVGPRFTLAWAARQGQNAPLVEGNGITGTLAQRKSRREAETVLQDRVVASHRRGGARGFHVDTKTGSELFPHVVITLQGRRKLISPPQYVDAAVQLGRRHDPDRRARLSFLAGGRRCKLHRRRDQESAEETRVHRASG